MNQPPQWLAYYPSRTDNDPEILALEEKGLTKDGAKWWIFLRALGPSAEYDLPPKDNEVRRQRRRIC